MRHYSDNHYKAILRLQVVTNVVIIYSLTENRLIQTEIYRYRALVYVYKALFVTMNDDDMPFIVRGN